MFNHVVERVNLTLPLLDSFLLALGDLLRFLDFLVVFELTGSHQLEGFLLSFVLALDQGLVEEPLAQVVDWVGGVGIVEHCNAFCDYFSDLLRLEVLGV